jgi:hypothetical protein
MEFGKGIALGVAAAMTIVVGLLAYELRGMGEMYRGFGDVALPVLTRMTIAAAWLIAVPLVGVAACVGLFVSRPRRLAPYVVLAIVMTAAAVLTWYGPRLPLFALAGNIQAD